LTPVTSSTPSPVVSLEASLGAVKFGNALPLAVIAGPCQLESRAHALETASALKEIAGRLGIGLVYKTSFDKANRTSASAARASACSRRCRSSRKSVRRWACRC
jgi:3-deoxy-D-manno-octulosonic acid (KDO) 8-phosphate synthase